jgi:hypothetical protein
VVLAQEEARLLNHNYIGTEHLLLGLVHEGEGIAARSLESLAISLDAVRTQVEEIIGRGGQAPSGHIPFTPRAKKVLELSLREALQLRHNYIGTEHILLGLIREGEGVAAQVLVKLGADLSRVRQQVIQLLSGYSGGDTDLVFTAQRGFVRETVVPVTPSFRASSACVFCGRDMYEVERVVTSDAGMLLCKDCAWLAVQTMERAPSPAAPVKPLRLPPHVFGERPDDDSVAQITALFEDWGNLDLVEHGETLIEVAAELAARWQGRAPGVTIRTERIRFITPDEAAVRFVISAIPQQPFDGRVVRSGSVWKVGRETYCMVAQVGGVPCPDEADDETDDETDEGDNDAA